MTIDMSNVQLPNNGTLFPGIYRGRISHAEYGHAVTSGNPRIAIQVTIDDEGVIAYGNVTWHVARSQQYLAALVNATDTMPADLQLDPTTLPSELIDKPIVVHVAPGQFEGAVTHQIRNYYSPAKFAEAKAEFDKQNRTVQQANGQRVRAGIGSGNSYTAPTRRNRAENLVDEVMNDLLADNKFDN